MGLSPPTGGATATAGARTRRVALLPGWVAAVGLVAVTLVGLPSRYRYVPLVVSAVVLGLPHGAIDPLAAARVAGASAARRRHWYLGVGILYLLLGVAYAVVWVVAPVVAAAAFIALTWFHWGQGDLHAMRAFVDRAYLPTRRRRVLFVAARGGFPMLVPLVAWPDQYRTVVGGFVARFGGGPVPSWPFDPAVRAALGAAFACLVGWEVASGWAAARSGSASTDAGRSAWRVDAAETALLSLLFLAVPPVTAVGGYFVCWHSVRHVVRFARLDPASAAALDAGRVVGPLARFAREAAPLSALALAMLAGAAVVVPRPPSTLPAAVALYLVFVSLLTLPHVVVVSWMDAAEGVWRSAADE
ncbi:Brp/Blh family beta-carotene 15,15'-dioxygenase [Candidatus Halobonum tyrrellensis]|uniref:Probable beta-carotene 15,15'-dioxygenase n=1 Tax=Candidatus Halobonum tyrrellensis G22 TaxID=1324957 RepID=V4HGM0_9EURY|nr:Brp/Blh family beta-carotene 15,15'-dioxygenase [Candidatus Halobonum tyrrellensis]ESP89258.1 brp-like protein [Candidatus Halobonum tyrrellensis G22]